MRRAILILSVLTWATAAAADPDPSPTAMNETAGFSGTWILDPDRSDGLQPPRPDANRSAQGRGGGKGGGGRGGRGVSGGSGGSGGRGGGHAGGPGESQPEGGKDDQVAARRFDREFARLEIFHAGQEWNLTNGLGISYTLATDGQPATVWTDRGPLAASATWQGQALAVDWKAESGQPAGSRIYSLDADGQVLTVHARLVRPDEDEHRTVSLVYRRETANPTHVDR